jgi:hypothetical protein
LTGQVFLIRLAIASPRSGDGELKTQENFPQKPYTIAMPKQAKQHNGAIPVEIGDMIAAGVVPLTASGKNALAVAFGRMGGLRGGPARAAKLSAEKRKEIGRMGSRARWGELS